jgi:hypothetical protein
MNQRIDELMMQSGARLDAWGRVDLDDFQYKKFAELIVRECADVLIAEMNRLDGLDRVVASQTMDTAQVLIKQHFGV